MVKSIYAIKDNLSFFYDVIVFDNDPIAVRSFKSLISSPGVQIHDNPEDFSLWKIGTFDNVDGVVTSLDSVCICKAIDFVSEVHNNEV